MHSVCRFFRRQIFAGNIIKSLWDSDRAAKSFNKHKLLIITHLLDGEREREEERENVLGGNRPKLLQFVVG